ncbi:hypothetical protein AAFC00_004494 [Neodothiora populina]|uniref:Mitochondrial carrier protein n=1 Tax=Neodothiora populina TaxID=2781224 RepID=A0ABR3P279_9PEZI
MGNNASGPSIQSEKDQAQSHTPRPDSNMDRAMRNHPTTSVMNSTKQDQDTDRPPPVKKKQYSSIMAFRLSDDARSWIKSNRTPIATGIASVSSTLIAYPLDFVKARMQSYNTRFGATAYDAWKHEGIKGMYRGCLTPIYTIAFVRVISFTTFQSSKHFYDDFSKLQFGVSPLDMANAPGQYPNIHTFGCFFFAGCAAGAVIPAFAAPFELLKLKSQLAGKMARDSNAKAGSAKFKTGTWGPALDMIRERGVFSLWKGFGYHLARDTLGTAIYFSVYEAIKQTLANARGNDPTDRRASMLAGGFCGMASWIIIYPIDVKKTLYQKRFLSGEPLKGPSGNKLNYLNAAGYRGLGVSMVRSGVINAMFFPVFESLKRVINAL